MTKSKQTVYFASYGFCAEGEDKVQGAQMVDADCGRLVKRLIEDFTRFTQEDYKLESSLQYQHASGCRVVGVHPSGAPIQLSFDFAQEDTSQIDFDLWSAFHWLALNTTNEGLSPAWREKAAKTLSVNVGVYHLS